MNGRSNITEILGYLLLTLGIIVHFWFFISNPGFYPQLFTVARSASSLEDLCKMLSITGECDSFYIYTWILAKAPTFLVPVYQIPAVILIFIIARKIFGSTVTAGLASFIYAISPGSLIVYNADQAGLALAGLLITISALITTYGLINEFKFQYALMGLVLYVALLGHVAVHVVLLLLAMVLLVRYISNQIDLRTGAILILFLISALITFFINGLRYYSLYSVPAVVLAIGVSLGLFLNKWLSTLSSHKVVYASIILVSAVTSGLLMLVIGSYSYNYTTTTNMIYVYGLPGLLSLPSMMLVFTNRKKLQAQLVAVAVTALLVNLFDPSIMSLVLAYLSLTSCVFIDTLLRVIKDLRVVNWKIRFGAPVALLVFITISFFGSYLAVSEEAASANVFSEITRLTADKGLGKISIDLTKLSEDLGRAVKSTANSSEVLIIAHWDYAYFLQSSLASEGLRAYLIANPRSGIRGKSLLSSIMVSSWETSKLILENISSEINVKDVYVFVSFAYSVSYGNNSFIGVPGSITLENYQYPVLVFDAYGDLYSIIEYLYYANKSIEDYLYVYRERPRTMALLWTLDGRDMLIAQLCVKSLLDSGYKNVYNYVIGQAPMNYTVSGFELVYSNSIEVGRISITYYGDYTVYYMVALFKLID
ncbi:MAG: hypothetical protein QXW93_01315 [Desulfurococcaceae archaeon]